MSNKQDARHQAEAHAKVKHSSHDGDLLLWRESLPMSAGFATMN